MHLHGEKILSDPSFNLTESKIILDIDEDFFGCDSLFNHLEEAGIKWSYVGKISVPLVLNGFTRQE